MFLHVTGRSVTMERTLGQSGKYFDHWIKTNAPVPFGEAQYFPAVRAELAAQEAIHQHHLQVQIDQVQNFCKAVHEELCVVVTGITL